MCLCLLVVYFSVHSTNKMASDLDQFMDSVMSELDPNMLTDAEFDSLPPSPSLMRSNTQSRNTTGISLSTTTSNTKPFRFKRLSQKTSDAAAESLKKLKPCEDSFSLPGIPSTSPIPATIDTPTTTAPSTSANNISAIQRHNTIQVPAEDLPEIPKTARRQYLVTYSKADTMRFPTRKSFGEFVVRHFNASYTPGSTSKVQVRMWAVCREKHADGQYHYHCSIKLEPEGKKWWRPWKAMYDLGVKVNFSDTHLYYASAFRYLFKDDDAVYTSPGHTRIEAISSPFTKVCNRANKTRREAAAR